MPKNSKKSVSRKPAFLSDDPSAFVFNHSISEPSTTKPSKKRKASRSLAVELDDDLPKKKGHKTTSSTFQDQEAFYSSLQEPDYSTFFLDNKADFMSLTRLSGMKFAVGSQVLAAVNDKGPNGLYMVVNLSRNKKAFIAKSDCPVGFNAFNVGEYVIGQVIEPKKESKSTQLTLRPEVLNESKREFIVNMIISAVLIEEEDHGWIFSVAPGIQAFVMKGDKENSNQKYIKNKPYILRIKEKQLKTGGLVICEFAMVDSQEAVVPIESRIVKKQKDELDIKQCLGPGFLFKALVSKIVENGLIVKFFGGILGFIYDEHLESRLKSFNVNDRIFATIIYFDPDSRKIVLSAKKHLTELVTVSPDKESIGLVKELNIAAKVSGEHYILKDGENTVFLSKNQAGEVGEKAKKLTVKLKDFNYLEGSYLGTALEEFMKKGLDWKEIRTGDILKGTIEGLKGNRLLISFKKGLKGVVDSLNFTDKQFQGFVKPKFKEGKTIRARVLSVDPVNKRLFLTIKPILMQESMVMLDDLEKIEPGKAYYGYISGKNEYGFIVNFFNNIKGVLSFKHLEEFDKLKPSSLDIGQTIKTYVLFLNKEKAKIGLSLTKPEKPPGEEKKKKDKDKKKKKKDGEEDDNKELKVGQLVDAKLVKISKNSLVFQLTLGTFKGFGRAHLSQFEFNPETHISQAFELKIGEKITGKILSLPKSSNKKDSFLDLTFLSKHLDLPEYSLESSLILPDLSKNITEFLEDAAKKSLYFPAMVRSLAPNSIHPLYFELSGTICGSVCAFTDLEEPQYFEKLNNLKEYFPEKSIHMVRIVGLIEKADDKARILKSLQLSLLPKPINLDQLEYGSLVIAKITKILDNSLRVQLSPGLFGSVDLLEVCDEFMKDPLHRFPVHHYLAARVVKKSNDQKIWLSLRETLVNDRVWQILTQKGTMAYKKEFNEIEEQGDLRARILKLGMGSLKTDMVFLGYVHQTNAKGCFIKLASDSVVRAKLSELSDDLIESPEMEFFKNKLVIGRIIKVHEDGKMEASLRESVVKYGFPLELENLKEGLVVEGSVEAFDKNDRAVIRIKGCRYMGMLAPKDSEWREQIEELASFSQVLKKGTRLSVKILNVNKEEEKVRVRLGNRTQDLEDGEEVKLEEKYTALFESVKEINRHEGAPSENLEEGDNLIKEENNKKGAAMEIEEEEDGKAAVEQEEEEEEDHDDDDDEEALLASSSEDEAPEEIEEEEELQQPEDELPNDNDDDKNDVKEEAEEDIKDTEKPKKKSKKHKDKLFLESELEIRKQEAELLNASTPQTPDDFEKLILQNPDSALTWISYIAFTMERSGIEAARDISKRAVESLNFKAENEKLNVWVAYLNLENSFGSEAEFVKVFSRALESNNPKKVFFKTLEIYRRDGKIELLEALANKMIKKHKNSCKAWIEYIRTMMFVGRTKDSGEIELKSCVTRALQSLEKRKHLLFLSHYARLEFLEGNLEKGRTTFEAIVTNYPKRVDLWAMYLDLEMKKGSKNSVRGLFERCISLGLKPKKMKFFFKRYLEFEVKEGNSERIEYVKTKANEYVEKVMKEEEEEEN